MAWMTSLSVFTNMHPMFIFTLWLSALSPVGLKTIQLPTLLEKLSEQASALARWSSCRMSKVTRHFDRNYQSFCTLLSLPFWLIHHWSPSQAMQHPSSLCQLSLQMRYCTLKTSPVRSCMWTFTSEELGKIFLHCSNASTVSQEEYCSGNNLTAVVG